jgi:hypothetical protein
MGQSLIIAREHPDMWMTGLAGVLGVYKTIKGMSLEEQARFARDLYETERKRLREAKETAHVLAGERYWKEAGIWVKSGTSKEDIEAAHEWGAEMVRQIEETNRARKEAAEEEKRLQKEADDAVKHARTEEEKFADAARQAHEWLAAGRISAAEEASLIRKAQADLLRSWEHETRFEPAKLARKGTAEEYEVIAKIQSAILGRDEQLSRLAAIEANTGRLVAMAERDKDKIKIADFPE